MKFSVKHVILPFAFFCLELLLALNQSIWLDESFTLHTTAVGFVDTLHRAVIFEAQPIAYFAILNLWRDLNSSIFFARLFSILMATAAVFLFQSFVQKRLKTNCPWVMTALFTFNPMLIWAGLEIRMYAMFILLSTALMSLFFSTFLTDKTKVKRTLGFSLLALLAVHTHYYVAFLLILCFVYLVFFKRTVLKSYLLSMVLPMLSLFVYVPSLNSQVAVHQVSGSGSVLYDFGFLWYDMMRNYLITFPDYFTPNVWNLLVILACVTLLLVFALRHFTKLSHAFQHEGRLALFLVIGLSFIFSLILLFLGTAAISTRHMLLFFMPLMLSFGLLIYAIQNKQIRTGALVVIFAFYGLNLFAKLPGFGKDTVMLDIQQVIERHGKKSEPRLFYPGENSLVYEDITGEEDVYDLPGTMDLQGVYHHAKWFLKDEKQLDERFAAFNEHPVLWLVDNQADEFYTEFMENRFQTKVNYEILNRYVETHFNVLYCDTVEDLYRIRKLERK